MSQSAIIGRDAFKFSSGPFPTASYSHVRFWASHSLHISQSVQLNTTEKGTKDPGKNGAPHKRNNISLSINNNKGCREVIK